MVQQCGEFGCKFGGQPLGDPGDVLQFITRGNARSEDFHKPEGFDAFLRIMSEVERNPLRAGLVARAEDWNWSSLWPGAEGPLLDPGPAPRGADWLGFVNAPMTKAEVTAIRLPLRRDRPFGADAWTSETAQLLDLESSLRPRGCQPRRASLQREKKIAQISWSTTMNRNVPFGPPMNRNVPFGPPPFWAPLLGLPSA